MEATIQSIGIASNVVVNIDTMKANIQRGLQQIRRRLFHFSLTSVYSQVLRMMYAAERATERHPVIADSILVLLGIALVAEIFFFC